MSNESTDRQPAIKLRLASQSVEDICPVLGCTQAWFHLWWRCYHALGPNGLFDLTRDNAQPRRIAPDLERAILMVRQRLASQTHPGTRYGLIGASAILVEPQTLHVRPLPCVRTIERDLQRNGITLPRVRLTPYLPHHTYPTPPADDSNQLHQVDCVGPIDLKGHRQRYYTLVGRDAFDGAMCLRIYRSRKLETILHFLGECWKTLGRPAQARCDNAREFIGWGQRPGISRGLFVCVYGSVLRQYSYLPPDISGTAGWRPTPSPAQSCRPRKASWSTPSSSLRPLG